MMGCENHTSSSDFILLGLSLSFPNKSDFLSIIFIVFIITITENTMMIDPYPQGQIPYSNVFPAQSSLLYGYLAYQQHCSQDDQLNFQAAKRFCLQPVASRYFFPSPSWVVSAFSWQQCPTIVM